jgi:hypothetical protein
MKAKNFFNGIFFFNLLSVVVIAVQHFTGYFISPEIQIAVLTVLNLVFRFTTGTVTAPIVQEPVKSKLWYESKMFWTSILSFIGAAIQSVTGWQIPPEAYLQIISGIAFVISIVTHKPVNIV